MSYPLGKYLRLPRRLPLSLRFKRYTMGFDGVDDRAEAPTHFFNDPMTVMTWVDPVSPWVNDLRYFFGTGDYNALAGYNGVNIGVASDLNVYVRFIKDTTIYDLATPSPPIYPVFVTLVRDGSYLALYINDEVVDDRNDIPAVGTPQLHTWTEIGATTSRGRFFPGNIPFVMIYWKPLTLREIQYNIINYPTPVNGDLRMWLYDRMISNVWYDESGYGNDATIIEATKKDLMMWEVRGGARL